MRNTVKMSVAALVLAISLVLGGASFAKGTKSGCGFGCKMKCEVSEMKCSTKCKKDAGCKSKCESASSACTGNKAPAPKK